MSALWWIVTVQEIMAGLVTWCVFDRNMKEWRADGEEITFWDTPFVVVLSFMLAQLWLVWLIRYFVKRRNHASTR